MHIGSALSSSVCQATLPERSRRSHPWDPSAPPPSLFLSASPPHTPPPLHLLILHPPLPLPPIDFCALIFYIFPASSSSFPELLCFQPCCPSSLPPLYRWRWLKTLASGACGRSPRPSRRSPRALAPVFSFSPHVGLFIYQKH